ncbi:MAG: universal stress protein [Bacteroidia bacterium]|nr:universal stress protein [Bacteroidia bacterium]
MKTILAGTDFTPSSLNACVYAGFLAKKLGCKLVIFNLLEVPAIHFNSGLYFISYNAVKENSTEKMLKTTTRVRELYPKIKLEELIVNGNFKDEITRFIKLHRVEAVVLGLAAKTQLSKFIYGSRSTDIAGKVSAPVIIVPEQYKTHYLKNLLLGVDSIEKLSKTPLAQFKSVTSDLKVKIKLLHIRTKNEVFFPEKSIVHFHNKNQRVETFFAGDIADGLNKYCHKNDYDLLAVISRNHSDFYDLFSESITKKIAFVSRIPVMAIHE